jgi:hypothetical protein
MLLYPIAFSFRVVIIDCAWRPWRSFGAPTFLAAQTVILIGGARDISHFGLPLNFPSKKETSNTYGLPQFKFPM